ncbi:MAG TPA: PhzF family phenazine biosynthesis protein [Gemmatimonadaceae bacterium]|nr:PhzF family phenazine biosynthesis protein [Gemmatimonadaceae bacterium]
MAVLPFLLVDAFTDRALAGNACAVVLDADALDDETMQAIAREMNQSETAFVRRAEGADAAVRFFTPAEEIPLAGHPTIATVKALLDVGRVPRGPGASTISLELRDGPIAVEIRPVGDDGEQITMTQRRPVFAREYDPVDVTTAFGLTALDVRPDARIQTVSTGTPQLMLPVRDEDALRRAVVDVRRYDALRRAGDFFSPHLFVVRPGAEAGRGRTFARHFGVPPDSPEDPFTGSATGGMAAYLWRYGLLEAPRFVAEQGTWMGRPGFADVEVVGERDAIESVRVGGRAVTVARGTLAL